MKKFYSVLSFTVILLLVIAASTVNAQTTVFSDNFNRAVLTTGAPTTYTTTVTAGDGGASINGSSFLEITNDATGGPNANGITHVTGLISSYTSPYNSTLSSNTAAIEWTFNFRYNRIANPSGFGSTFYGVAIVLASNSATLSNAGNGYAVVYGNNSTPDPIRLVKYTGGLTGTLTDICTSGVSDIANVTNYASVRVVYNPTDNSWSLYVRDDGVSAWADPSSGVTSQKGTTTIDNTYTGSSLGTFGFLWSYSTTANQTDQFDNYKVVMGNPSLSISATSLDFEPIYPSNFSASKTYNLSGFGLTGAPSTITVTSPNTDFQVSNDNSSWGASTTIAYSSATLSATPVYVRFSPQSTGAKSGNISNSGGGSVIAGPSLTGTGLTASAGDYRSKATGDWTTLATWERFTAGVWVAAPSAPNNTDGTIIIQNGHTVTVSSAVTADELTVNAGGQLTVNGGVTLTLNNGPAQDLTVYGTVQDNGTITGAREITINNGGVVNVSGIFNLTVAASTLTLNTGGNLNLSGTSSSTVAGNTTLTVDGTLTMSGSSTLSLGSVGILVVNNIVNMSGSSTITVTRGNGGTVGDVNAGGVLTLSGTASVINASGANGRTFNINAGGIVHLGPTTTLTGTGEVSVNSGGTIEIGSTVGITTSGATGNVQSTFRTYDVGANYTYSGLANQVMGNAYPNNLTGILTINNPGNTVTLDNARTIAAGGSVNFVNGVLSTATNLLTFADNATVGTISNTSYVDGQVRKTGNDNFFFPTGDPAGSYHTIGIDNTAGAVGDTYTAEYFRANALTKGPIMTGAGLYGISHCEYWELTRNAGVSTPHVSVSWTTSSPCGGPYVTTLSGLTVAWLNGSNQWQVANGSGTNTSGNSSAGFSQRLNVTSFGFFALGNVQPDGSPLPVKFGSIKAYPKNNGIQVDWTALTELNVDHYEVERSANGTQFTSMNQTNALNNGNRADYGWFDATPFSGTNFYRIRSIDQDGKSGYSIIVRVDLGINLTGINIFPNPVTGSYVSIQTPELAKGMYTVKIFSSNGQLQSSQQFNHGGGTMSQSVQLPGNRKPGIYLLELESNGLSNRKLFIVQ